VARFDLILQCYSKNTMNKNSLKYARQIEEIVKKQLADIADISVSDSGDAAIIEVRIRRTGDIIKHDIRYGMGLASTARAWAKSMRSTWNLPA